MRAQARASGDHQIHRFIQAFKLWQRRQRADQAEQRRIDTTAQEIACERDVARHRFGFGDQRVERVEGSHVFVAGDNPAASTDSRHYGAVTANDVLGRAMLRLPSRHSRLPQRL